MKKIQSAVYGIAAVLTAILPKIFVCPQGGSGAMRCWQTAEAESLIALGFLMIGFILIVTKSEKIKTITDLAAMAISAMGVMIPLKWIGGCMNPLMPCHTIGFPLTYGICATVFFAAAVGLAVQLKKFVKPSLTTVCETEK